MQMEWINELGKVAASVTAILGLITLIFFKPVKKYMDEKKKRLAYREKRYEEQDRFYEFMQDKMSCIDAQINTISNDVSAMSVNMDALNEKVERIDTRVDTVSQKVEVMSADMDDVKTGLNNVSDDTGNLQYERLTQAHDFYTLQQKWCPNSRKKMLCDMYTSYKSKGKNHITEHFIDDIMALASGPQQQQQPAVQHN